ncbi:DUF4261 domain-containing protein [Roseomonas sp. GC11]|uniref:DUF4261 domain-containing protein n=1 Tax=Roseomonas sp. GC11 TaxID=2950546 RepID=UPI00210B213E|nr:DUF4261 domain-containing protein [Roseomonas sp. GC11]MCQ4160973.1 DUF4261 domain-containing protein [Roseomonas sp. GC11]
MAMILLRSATSSLEAEVVAAALSARFAGEPIWRALPGSEPGGPALMAHAGQTFVVAQVDGAVPAPQIEAYVAAAYWWPSAQQELADHQAHLVVSTLEQSGTETARAALAARGVLRLAALLAERAGPNAVAGLWANSETAWRPADFVAQASSEFPVNLWMDLRLLRGRAPEEVGVATRGLDLFLGLNLVMAPTAMLPPEQLAKRCTSIALYLMQGGDLRDGDTIAGGQGWQWRARRHPQGPQGGAVLVLSAEATAEPQRT